MSGASWWANMAGTWFADSLVDDTLDGTWTFNDTQNASVIFNISDFFPDQTTGDVPGNETVVEEIDLRIHHPALAVLLAFFCITTVFGNALVMVAIRREPYLHTVTNYFIASLATADCLVGAIVMPFSAVHEVMDKYWTFGQAMCDLWHSFDVLGSTSSILHMCVISLDRYWAITNPMAYPSLMTPTKATILIAVVWVCAALISFPAIAWWRAVSPDVLPPYQCLFTDDIGYLVFSSIVSFYAPLMVMVFFYYRIYKTAVEQMRSLNSGSKQIQNCNGEESEALTLRIHRGGGGTVHSDDGYSGNSVAQRNQKSFSISRKVAKLAKERKAAKTLGIVMGVFILCWLPFFIVNILMGICGEVCVFYPDTVISVVTWLGWINSSMNPFIYASMSRDFRRAFAKLLCSCWLRRQKRYRNRGNNRSRGRSTVGLTSIKSSRKDEVSL